MLPALKYGDVGLTIEDSLEILAGRIGFIVLVTRTMHFNNLFWCELIEQRRIINELRQRIPLASDRIFTE